jgi:cell division transport system permease protein
MPAMIDVDVRGDADVATAEAAAKRVVPAARIDRHAQWLSPVRSFMATLTWLAAGLVLLMATATGAVVLLAARSGLDTHRDTIEVLHMLGSTDLQVARLFQRRIAFDTLIGGALGSVLALGLVWFLQSRFGALGSEVMSGVALQQRDWFLLLLLPIGFALLATFAARLAVLRALGKNL